MSKRQSKQRGFTLIELLISMALAAILITGITQLVMASATSYQLQQNLGAMQESARYAFSTIRQELEAAGYQAEPWESATDIRALGERSVDAFTATSDRISVQRWSNQNCFNNDNSDLDESGHARFYLRESTFSINGSDNLALTCRYGREAGQLVTQVNNLGLVENAEAFQVLYAEDTNSDGNADRWVTAGQWFDESNILAARLALLIATPDWLAESAASQIQLLDSIVNAPDDGRLRRVFESSIALKGRIK